MNKNTTTSTENLYHLNGKISVKQAIPFGLQHILAMFVANIAPIFIVAAASGLSTHTVKLGALFTSPRSLISRRK